MKKIFEGKEQFSEVSGVCTYVDDNVYIRLNDFGMYEEYFIDYKESKSNLIYKVSPNFNTDMNETIMANKLYSKIDNIQYNEVIGYYQKLYAGYVKEGDFRDKGSSGGMGTWILKSCLIVI